MLTLEQTNLLINQYSELSKKYAELWMDSRSTSDEDDHYAEVLHESRINHFKDILERCKDE